MNTLNLPQGYPKIIKMASGHLSLELSDNVSYESFLEHAELFLASVGGVIKKRNDSFIMCIWKVEINNREFQLVYDDYPCGVSLESDSDASDQELLKIMSVPLSRPDVQLIFSDK